MPDFAEMLAIGVPVETPEMRLSADMDKLAAVLDAVDRPGMRPMTEADIPSVVEIENKSFTKEAYPEQVFRDWLAHGLTGTVVERNEKVAAYLLDRDDDKLPGFRLGQSLAVHPDHRREGLGETLMRDMMAKHAKVSAQVDTTNKASRGMLKKLGFRTVRTYKDETRRAHLMKYETPEKEAAELTLAELKAQSGKTDTDPSDAQKESGNYKKGRVKWKGLTLAIENPQGTIRSGKSKDGKSWSVVMKSTYGYIVGQRSKADGDNVDVFLSDEHLDSELLFIVDQVKASGEFDEHKVLAGWIDIESAKAGYLANYSKGWTGLGNITPITLPQFKDWLEHGDTKKPYAGTARHDKDAGVRDLAGYEDALCLPVGYQLQGLRSKGHPSLQKVAGELRGVPVGHGTVPAQVDARTERHDQGLHADELPMGDGQRAGEEQTDKSAADARREDAHADRVVRDKEAEADDRTHEDREGYVGFKGANDGGEVETEEEFWKRNEAEKEARKDHKLGHIRDGYILCGCGFRYHAMPADEMCHKCGKHITVRLRSMTKKANSGIENPVRHVLISGHSGAGKSTLSDKLHGETGYPVVSLDKHPLWAAWKAQDDALDPAEANRLRRENNQKIVADVLANTKEPSIIEGTQLLHADPELVRPHRRILLDPKFDDLVSQRLGRDRTKPKFSPEGMGLPEDEWAEKRRAMAREIAYIYRPYVPRWRSDPGVEVMGRTKEGAFYPVPADQLDEPVLFLVKRGADEHDHPFTIAIDLDGTLAEQEVPFDADSIGEPIERALAWVRRFRKAGARLIIFTVRGDNELVKDWLEEHDVPFDYINENPDQPEGSSGKIFADIYYDDRAVDARDHDTAGPEVLERMRRGEKIDGKLLLSLLEEADGEREGVDE